MGKFLAVSMAVMLVSLLAGCANTTETDDDRRPVQADPYEAEASPSLKLTTFEGDEERDGQEDYSLQGHPQAEHYETAPAGVSTEDIDGVLAEILEEGTASYPELPEDPDNGQDAAMSAEERLRSFRLTKEQFDAFLYDLVANPHPNDEITFLQAAITAPHTIELQLDLKSGSLESIWVVPLWDIMIRQLYVDSYYQAEPTIIIRDANGVLISNRDQAPAL